MPFVFDYSQDGEFDDETEEYRAPTPDQFMYIPPPKFGGAHDPVDISSFFKDAQASQQQENSTGLVGKLKSLLGMDKRRSEQGSHQDEPISMYVIPALDSLGVSCIYCRYDGGNDEGFSWLDRVDLKTGEQLNENEFIDLLASTGLADELMSSSLFNGQRYKSPRAMIEDIIRYWVCDEWASWLLGRGFGTGEFSMFGAFTVDFTTRTIQDDQSASPIVENIELDLGQD